MWGYRTCRVAGVRALRALVRPSHPHVGLLFRVWATPPMYGTGVPRAEQAARVREKGCSPTPGSLQCAQARYFEPGPSHPHVGLLFRVWATPPMYGTGGPRAGQAARVRDRRPACGTGGPRAGHVGVQVVVACGQSTFALVADGVVHPIGWHCNPPDWVQRPLTGAALPNGCSASRVTAALPIVQVPVGGGPPARSPHASLRLGVVDLEARPGPAAAPGHRFCPRVPQPSLLLPSEPGGCCGGMRQAVAVFDRCGIAK